MIQIDMEMPDSCRECWFLKYDMYAGVTSCEIKDMILANYFKKLDFEGRHEECPLIDVPDINVGNITKEQPEIIRCKDCAYVDSDATCFLVCGRKGMGLKPYHVYHDDYCSYAERKTDG